MRSQKCAFALMFCSAIYGADTGPVYNWGRVRADFTAGLLLSNHRDAFAGENLFLSFDIDKNWFLSERAGWRRLRCNSFFGARLTAVPVAEPADTLDTVLSSRKAASVQAGVYLPVTATEWKINNSPNSLFVAPLARVAFTTPAESSPKPEVLFTSYAFGLRLGHYRETESADQAPELISNIDLTLGRFENLEHFEAGNPGLRVREWRYAIDGTLRIPETPFIIGFSANVGAVRSRRKNLTTVPDDLRFLFGVRFDGARLFRALKKV